MADKKISELTAITGANTAADDYFVVVDTSGTATKKISRAELNNAIEADVLSTVNIDGGTIDGVTMATSDITVGSGKTLNVSAGTLTLADDQISGDKINGGTITSTFSGNLTGNVTGNASGTAATVTAGAQPNITSTGTLTSFRSTGIDDNADALAITIDSSENIQFGSSGGVTGGRYFDLYNTASGATDFGILRFITQQVGSSSTTSADIYKRKNGQFTIANNDTDAATFISFQVGASERMRLTGGKLGVGTTAPVAPLGLVGGTSNASDLATSYSTAAFNITPKSTSGWSLASGSGASDIPYFQVSAGGSAAGAMTLNPYGGYVGIGVTPTATLHTSVSSGANKLIVQNTAASQQSVLQLNTDSTTPGQCQIYMGKTSAGTNGQVGYDPNSDYMYFYTSNSEKMRLLSDGKLGIGTTAPIASLSMSAQSADTALSGTSNAAGLHMYMRAYGISQIDSLGSGGNNSGLSLRTYNNGTYTKVIENIQGNTTTFQTAGTERARIAATGEFSVGNTSATGMINVTATSWSKNCLYLNSSTSGDADFCGIGMTTAGTESANIYTDESHNFSITRRTGGTFYLKSGSSGISGGTTQLTLNDTGDLIVGGTASVVKNASGNDVAGKFVDVQPGTAVTGGVVVGSTGRGGTTSADYRQGFFLRRSDGWSTSQSGMWKGSHSSGSDINYWERMKIGNSGGGAHIDFEINDDTKMTLTTGGRLNVGTLTGASARLHLLNSAVGEQCLYSDATHASYANINALLVVTRAANSAYAFLQTKSGNGADLEHNLRGDGEAYADASWNASGADYAEFWEWADGNPDAEDRRGLSVVLDGEKIRLASADDDASQIIGVVSGNPCVVGDNAWNKWRGKYLRDDFGAYDLTEDGDRQLNPDYDPDQEYIPRSDRKEWSAVGLMGKLRVRKGQPVGDRWLKMRDINSGVEEYLVR